jgi:signal transduction histidine kinase
MSADSSFGRLLRSASVRVALSYALVFIVSTLLLVGYLWWRTANYLDQETDAVIIADTRAIGDRLRDFGLPGALEAINDRLKLAADEHAIYLLTDPMLTPVGGNLSAWPAQVGRSPGWYEVKVVQDGKLHATRILNVNLPADFHLLVGRDIQDRAAIRDVILNGLASAAFAALVLAVAGGIMVRRAVFKRVETINRTAAAIVQGDLARRVPTSRSADEFDQLSGTINEMLDQLQLLIEGIRGASDAIAHDLRTPLAEMRARLEALLRKRPPPDATFEEIAKTMGDIDRLIAVFNALLRLADIRSGVRRSGFRDVEIDRILADVMEFYAPMAEEKSMTLELAAAAPASSPLVVKGDPDLLAQAIGNLLDNAIKYAPAGSTVAVALTRLPGRVARLEVRDRGPGIPQGERELVTRQFYRGGQSDVPGTGLGLSLVHAVVHLHGGRLELSDNHPGLSAALILPLAGGAPAELRAPTLALSQ